MTQIIADLQLHSKYSRAVSKEMTLPNICAWTKRKGMSLVATGDWNHPLWMREIQEHLEEMGNGLLRLRPEVVNKNLDPSSVSKVARLSAQSLREREAGQNFIHSSGVGTDPLFLLASEVSCIYTQGGKGRRVHTLIWVPSIASALKINKEMTKQGCNLLSDGRPIIGLTSIQVADLVFTIEPKALVIPAHAWTPWFSVFGSKSGFDSIDEAFGPFAKQIFAVETGLSSNPSMNWRIKELDRRSIVSFSDAHSGPKLGREATVFDVLELSYDAIYEAIRMPSLLFANKNLDASSIAGKSTSSGSSLRASEATQNFVRSPRSQSSIAYTIEFYPEEGKYHWSGHRACNIRWGPKETAQKGTTCPVCGKGLTEGVEQRVNQLAGRDEDELQLTTGLGDMTFGGKQVLATMTRSMSQPHRPPFTMMVPLQEIIAECIGSPVTSPKVQSRYTALTDALGGEFHVLLTASTDEIHRVAGERIAQGIEKVRMGNIVIDPGYDGVFGVVKLWKDDEDKPLIDDSREQLRIV